MVSPATPTRSVATTLRACLLRRTVLHALLQRQVRACCPQLGHKLTLIFFPGRWTSHFIPNRIAQTPTKQSLSTIDFEQPILGRQSRGEIPPPPGGRAEQRQFHPRHSDPAPHAGPHRGAQCPPAHFGFQGRGRVLGEERWESGAEGGRSVFGGFLHPSGHNGDAQALGHRGGGEKRGGVGAEQYRGHATYAVGKKL